MARQKHRAWMQEQMPQTPFHDIDHLVVVAERGERFKSAVDVAELGQGFDHGFVVHDKLEMDRFRQNRMLRSERNDRTGHDALPTFW